MSVNGFFQNDINVYHVCYDKIDIEKAKENKYDTTYRYVESLYKILYIVNGNGIIRYKNFAETVPAETLVIAGPNSNFRYEFSRKNTYEFYFIDIHPNIFKIFDEDEAFLKPFIHLKNEQCFFDLKTPECNYLATMVHSFKNVVEEHYNRHHIISRVLAIISELNVISDRIYRKDSINTDSIAVKINDYILRNYTSDLTCEKLSKKFFISVPTLNKIIKCYSNRSLKKYINYLRLKNARQMLYRDDISIADIAKLSGFNNYSTFYRAFIKEYGYPPKEHSDRPKEKSNKKWPLSK